MRIVVDGAAHEVEVGEGRISVDGRELTMTLDGDGRRYTIQVDGRPYHVELPERLDAPFSVQVEGKPYQVEEIGSQRRRRTPFVPPLVSEGPQGTITACMAGRILRLEAAAGAVVQTGDLLLVLEAMKMENEIRAPRPGRVRDVPVTLGQLVREGERLIVIEQQPRTSA